MMTDAMSFEHAIRLDGKAQAPHRFLAGRVCAEPECAKKLSSYNRSEMCYEHRPICYPRTRGRTITALPIDGRVDSLDIESRT